MRARMPCKDLRVATVLPTSLGDGPGVSLVEQRDRCVPFDGVPDRRRKLTRRCSSARTFEWAPQPWSTLTTVPSETENAFAQTPNRVPRLPLQAYEEPAGLADIRRQLAELVVRAALPDQPALGRLVSAFRRKHALPAQSELGDDRTRITLISAGSEFAASSPPV